MFSSPRIVIKRAITALVLCSLPLVTEQVKLLKPITKRFDPALPYDPNTTPLCQEWWDNYGVFTCDEVLDLFELNISKFRSWNPSITSTCGNFIEGRAYCVSAAASTTSQRPVLSSTSKTSTTVVSRTTLTTTTSASSTKPWNGVRTPEPSQPSMVADCNRFYWVKPGDTCESVAKELNIWSVAITLWNPQTMSDCSGLWANAWACVGVNDPVPTTISRAPTPTTPPNGVVTPQPTQPEMVANCNRFYWVKPGDSCDSISRALGVWVVAITLWNPRTMADCSGLWANAWACVGTIS